MLFFSLFFLFGYSDSGLVKLTQVSSSFFFVFLLNFYFFARSIFWNSFLSRSHITGCGFVKLAQVDSGFLIQHYNFWISFLFSSLTLSYLVMNFTTSFRFFFRIVSISYHGSCFSKFNPICLGLSLSKYYFLHWKNLKWLAA